MQMIDIEGRKLPLEKIFFRNKTIIANEEADWGRDAVKEHVISPVSAVCPLILHSLILHSLILHPLILHPLILHPLTLHPLTSVRSPSKIGSWW